MGFEDAITKALDLQGAELGEIVFDDENLAVMVTAIWPFHLSRCRECGDFLLKIHSWETREVRAPSFGVYSRVTLKLRYARGLCRSCCRVRTSKVLFVHPEFESITCGLAEQAGRMMEEITCEATERLYSMKEIYGKVHTPELVRQMQSRLGQLDFTVTDAETAVKTLLLHKLHVLHEQDRYAYDRSLRTLMNGDEKQITELIQNDVLNPLGLKHGLEGRVPVAVPTRDLIHF